MAQLSTWRILVLLALAAPAALAGTPCGEALRRHLAAYAYQTDASRAKSDIAVWRAYKNSPNPNPVRVDLSDFCQDRVCPLLEKSRPATQYRDRFSVATEYESIALHLRKGDTVVFDGEEFVLGEFLGAGNTTHIYRLQNHPGEAIRLPFVTDEVMVSPVDSRGRIKRLQEMRSWVLAYEDAMAGRANGVLKRTDRAHRFVIVKEVQGTLSGADLLVPHITTPPKAYGLRTSIWPDHFRELTSIPADQRRKIEALLDLMVRNSDAYVPQQGKISVYIDHTRQYIWDEKELRWYLVDKD